MPVKVAVIGAGNVGKTLGGKIARSNPVAYGVRDVAKYADLVATNQTVKPVADAIQESDVVILTVPGMRNDEWA
jgi:predicted dinucleotide-binding enzyme